MVTHRKLAVAIRHVAFEGAGLFLPILAQAGWQLSYCDAPTDDLKDRSIAQADLLIVLGGPIGVYEGNAYPFIAGEVAAVAGRIAAEKPILGICLGAQMMAAALEARVAPGPHKEIGWAPLTLTAEGNKSVLAPLGITPVLHWHGDNCELPANCSVLASTANCPVQAFIRSPSQLALQFHLETDPVRFESWLVGHTVELGKAGIDPNELRKQAQTFGQATLEVGRKVLAVWLDRVAGAPV